MDTGRGRPYHEAMASTLDQAHDHAWQRIGEPGTWLSGAQRVAIAQETRNSRTCELCAQRKQALSPFAVDGDHDAAAHLSADMVDAAHRITSDPGRLTESWLRSLDVSDAEYVELVGVAITAIGVDTFDRATGAPVRTLPEAHAGEPSRRRPQATDDCAWVPMRKLPGMPNVARALSLVPEEAKALQRLVGVEYVPTARIVDMSYDPGKAISRQQIELIATRVSAIQDCFY